MMPFVNFATSVRHLVLGKFGRPFFLLGAGQQDPPKETDLGSPNRTDLGPPNRTDLGTYLGSYVESILDAT